MGFRNSKQRSEICRVLLEMKGLDRFYVGSDIGYSGFTEDFEGAIILIKANESTLSPWKQTLLLTVKDFWNGGGGAKVHDVMANLDATLLVDLFEEKLPSPCPGHADDA